MERGIELSQNFFIISNCQVDQCCLIDIFSYQKCIACPHGNIAQPPIKNSKPNINPLVAVSCAQRTVNLSINRFADAVGGAVGHGEVDGVAVPTAEAEHHRGNGLKLVAAPHRIEIGFVIANAGTA